MHLFIFLILISPKLLFSETFDFSGKTEMNGIRWKDYDKFINKWPLITVRYRKDTNEMRMVFANSTGRNIFKNTKRLFPEGTVIVKAGIATGSDPFFESSAIPTKVWRYQIMVKDSKKYNKTNGWGYALFDSQGKTFPEDPDLTQKACHACHTIVEEKDYVFSEPFLQDINLNYSTHKKSKSASIFFEEVEREGLFKELRDLIPSKYKMISRLRDQNLENNIFQGTLDEIRPLLLSRMKKLNGIPVVFYNANSKKFSIALDINLAECLNENGVEFIMTSEKDNLIRRKICFHE
jgi:hypothetical protein